MRQLLATWAVSSAAGGLCTLATLWWWEWPRDTAVAWLPAALGGLAGVAVTVVLMWLWPWLFRGGKRG